MTSPAKAPKKRPRQKRRAFKHGVGQVYSERRDKWVWAFDVRVSGARLQESGFPTRERAEAAVARLRLRALDEKYGLPSDARAPGISLSELVEARLKDPACKRAATYADCGRVLNAFGAYFPADQPVNQLTTSSLRDFLAEKRSAIQPSTVNRELNYISAMLNAAGSYFPELEHWKPPRLPRPPEPEGRDRPLTLDEARRIVTHLRAPLKRKSDGDAPAVADIFQLALMSGMRQGEWRLRKWREIDFESGVIRLTKTKTGKARTVMMSAPVRAVLERRREITQDSPYIFPGQRKRDRPMCPNTISLWLRKAAERLEIPYGRKTEGGFTFHDSRHTAVTNMLHDGHDLATVADISGHSKKTMALRYSHATSQSLKRAMTSLEKFDFGSSVEEKQQSNSDDDAEIA